MVRQVTVPAADRDELSLSRGEMTILPLMPVLLAARSGGYPCEAKREQVFQAMAALEVDLEGVDVVARVLSQPPGKRDLELLTALAILVKTRQLTCDLSATLCWCLRVLSIQRDALWKDPGPWGTVSPDGICWKLGGREAVMLVVILRGLGRAFSPRVLSALAKPLGLKVSAPSQEEYLAWVEVIFSASTPPPEDSAWPKCTYSGGRIVNSLPVLGIPATEPRLAESPIPQTQRGLLKLLAGSLSLSVAEKQRVLDSIPRLFEGQISDLTDVWMDERKEFSRISIQQVLPLERRAATQWLEIFKERVPSQVLKEPWTIDPCGS